MKTQKQRLCGCQNRNGCPQPDSSRTCRRRVSASDSSAVPIAITGRLRLVLDAVDHLLDLIRLRGEIGFGTRRGDLQTGAAVLQGGDDALAVDRRVRLREAHLAGCGLERLHVARDVERLVSLSRRRHLVDLREQRSEIAAVRARRHLKRHAPVDQHHALAGTPAARRVARQQTLLDAPALLRVHRQAGSEREDVTRLRGLVVVQQAVDAGDDERPEHEQADDHAGPAAGSGDPGRRSDARPGPARLSSRQHRRPGWTDLDRRTG